MIISRYCNCLKKKYNTSAEQDETTTKESLVNYYDTIHKKNSKDSAKESSTDSSKDFVQVEYIKTLSEVNKMKQKIYWKK